MHPGTKGLTKISRYGRLVRCDIPAPRNPSSRLFAFVEYEKGRDADDAYDEMHGKAIGRDVINVEWARTPPSASWRFEPGDRDRRDARGPPRRDRDRSPPPRRRSRTPPPRRGGGRGYSPRRDDRRERDYDRRDRGRDRERERSRSPGDGMRDRDMKDVRDRSDDDAKPDDQERAGSPRPAEDELDTAE